MAGVVLNPRSVHPNELKTSDWVGYKVIAVIGHNNDWAAYAGLADWSNEEVAENGDKVDKKAAEALFPMIVRSGRTYRSY